MWTTNDIEADAQALKDFILTSFDEEEPQQTKESGKGKAADDEVAPRKSCRRSVTGEKATVDVGTQTEEDTRPVPIIIDMGRQRSSIVEELDSDVWKAILQLLELRKTRKDGQAEDVSGSGL